MFTTGDPDPRPGGAAARPPRRTDRDTDLAVVLVGATGFVGRLTAEYLAANMPEGRKWGIAGRSADKLRDLADELPGVRPEIIVVDVDDAVSVAACVGRADVVATTVGPYLEYGEPIVAACAEAGADYVDLTGEPEFIDRMYVRHHARAQESGARIVHACGFDSIPHDLGAWFTVGQLDRTKPITVRGVVRAKAQFSGGTFHSALGAVPRRKQGAEALAERRALERRPEGRRVSALRGIERSKELGQWLMPLPTVDPQIVRRSAAADDRYGTSFTYGHFAGMKKFRTVLGTAVVAPIAIAAILFPPTRKLLLRRIARGTGPSAATRASSWFTVTFLGTDGERNVRTRVSGGDPGYSETAKMLAESAMCLAFDDNPPVSGQVTTATAMGENLVGRLRGAGMNFEILDAGEGRA